MRSNNVKDSRNRVFFLAIFFILIFYSSMKILSLNNYFHQTINSSCNKNSNSDFSSLNSVIKQKDIPTYAIKANYLPNFGKYKKVADITLIDKDTERPVRASLRKERTGDFISFEITTGRKDQAGFLHMDLEPEDIYEIPQNKNGETIPGAITLGIVTEEQINEWLTKQHDLNNN